MPEQVLDGKVVRGTSRNQRTRNAEIWKLYIEEYWTQTELAEHYGLSQQTVSNILFRRAGGSSPSAARLEYKRERLNADISYWDNLMREAVTLRGKALCSKEKARYLDMLNRLDGDYAASGVIVGKEPVRYVLEMDNETREALR